MDIHKDGKILIDQAERCYFHFNDRLEPKNRKFMASELLTAIQRLNRRAKNPNGFVGLNEFRDDFRKLFFKE